MVTKGRFLLSNFQMRVLSAVIGIPVLISVIWLGGYVIVAVATVVVFFALRELLSLLKRAGWGVFSNEGLMWGATVVATAAFGGKILLIMFGAGAVLMLGVGFAYRRSGDHPAGGQVRTGVG